MASVPEADVLKPRSPSITDENEWPEFTLTSVDCYNAQGEQACLLDADEKHPMTVVGKLAKVDKSQAHLLIHSTKSRVSLSRVTKYAYGQNVDGDGNPTGISFWAAGDAGWFKMEPSRKYKDVFQSMTTTIEKLYFLVDTYSSKIRTDMRDLFFQYAEKEGLRFAEDAASLFHADRFFLIHAMLKDMKEHHLLPAEYDWARTPFYEHLVERYPEDVSAVLVRLGRKPLPASSKQPTADQPKPRGRPRKDQSLAAEEVDPRSGKDMIGRGARRRGANAQSVKRDDAWWKARAILEFMQKALALKLVSSRNLTMEGFAQAMVRSYDVQDEETAKNYIKTHADQLIPMMEAKKHEVWMKRTIYQELIDAQVPVADVRRMQQLKLTPRRPPVIPSDSEISSDTSSSTMSEDELMLEPPTPNRRAKKGRLSIMRPTPSKYNSRSGKARGKGPSTKSVQDESDDLLDLMELDESSASGRPTTRRKREHKKRKTEPSTSESDHSLIISDSEHATNTLPLRWKRSTDETAENSKSSHLSAPSPISISLLQTKAASSAAPHSDIWHCPQRSCSVKIFGSQTPTSQKLIFEHKRSHAEADASQASATPDDPLLALVQSEARDDLPVNNLLKKIQAMADFQRSKMPVIDGSREKSAFPQRIKQRY